MKKNFVEELRWRGMLQDIMPGTEEQLNKEMTTAYVGIDPTADSLHIGHLVGVMMLKHLQETWILITTKQLFIPSDMDFHTPPLLRKWVKLLTTARPYHLK